MSYHLINSPDKLSAGVEHAATNCGGEVNGRELVGGTSSSPGGSFSLEQTTAELDRFTGWVTELTWVVFMFSFSLAVGVLLVLWCCSRRRGGECQDEEEQSQICRNQSFDNEYLLRRPVTLYKSNEKIAEDGSGVLKKAEEDRGEGKGDM